MYLGDSDIQSGLRTIILNRHDVASVMNKLQFLQHVHCRLQTLGPGIGAVISSNATVPLLSPFHSPPC